MMNDITPILFNVYFVEMKRERGVALRDSANLLPHSIQNLALQIRYHLEGLSDTALSGTTSCLRSQYPEHVYPKKATYHRRG